MFESIYRTFVVPLRDFVYPPLCLACAQQLDDDEFRVCSPCWKSFRRLAPGDPTWMEIRSKLAAEGVVEELLTCYLFEKEGKLQDVIHALKYSGMKSLGVQLGKELGQTMMSQQRFAGADLLIPIPLHSRKQRERGYNQSEYICRGVAEVTGLSLNTHILRRCKYTESQTHLDLLQRKINVEDAFVVHPKYVEALRGKTCILVDDVITTGSTINAAGRALLAAGAERVLVASVALAE